MSKNRFLKFIPLTLALLAIALLFIPKKVSYIDVEKFFSDTDAFYQPAQKTLFKHKPADRDDYYYPGVRIGKLWKRLGISPVRTKGHLRDEYLFGCSLTDHEACILPYPAVKEYEFGRYLALRVSSSSQRFPDYQYLFFSAAHGGWRYFGHIDVFDNKKGEPVFKLLDEGLASVVSLAGMGQGYHSKFLQVYALDGHTLRTMLGVPFEAVRRGVGLLDFDINATCTYADEVLDVHYQIAFAGESKTSSGSKASVPLFSVTRRLSLIWDGKYLVYDKDRSDITPTELVRIVSGSYARVYATFRPEFDKLLRTPGPRQEWFQEFMGVVKDEGVPLGR